MKSPYPFTIYNAAAGAGKTYTLVKSYLIALFTGEYKETYKNILAITFTNKAVSEMKTRVLENLVGLSDQEPSLKYRSLLNDIVKETGLDELTIRKKANRILKSILHNYAAFDIVTIDTFTHRVIRTFARDLGIPMNFEIEMDTESLIEESVDAIIAKVGDDKALTKTIIDFALSKLEEDKNWDITVELNKIARLLFSENDRMHLDNLSGKTAEDFKSLRTTLAKKISESKKSIISDSKEVLDQMNAKEIADKDFTRGSIPAHFKKLEKGDTNIDFKASWKQNIQTASFYGVKLENDKKESIDSLRPLIEQAFLDTKQKILIINLYENIIKNLTPLSVLNLINKELQNIKRERSILLISEFNKIISEAIQDQPAPFIYERLGERYRDYFIDEFQDTSELQWNNIIPLIDNAISSETLSGKRGQLTIVGDAKQAIYRWRGGKAEQFIDLSLDQNPFSIEEKQVLNLPRNYRSHQEIIKFNNDLFTFLSNDFSSELHKKLYLLGNNQEYNDKKEGYVKLSFIEAKNVTEENEIYPEKVYESVLELKEKGYLLNEICILTRKQKEGALIADFLTERGLSIISSETLLLKNDPKVCFVIDMLTWFIYPDELLAKTKILNFITEQFSIEDQHRFLKKLVFTNKKDFCSQLKLLGIDFDFHRLDVKPFYEAVEYIVHSFRLTEESPAYVQFLLDVIFAYTQKNAEGVVGFLSYWEHKKEKLSIIAPEGEEAIQIMTIHKSKGLEFPCVIYPYANIDIYREIEPKTWLPVSKNDFDGFEEVFVNYNKQLSEYGSIAEKIVQEHQSQLELDTFNLLYVALTRAEEQLYVISKSEINSKGETNSNKFSGKLINYLKHIGRWNSEQLVYDFGNLKKPNKDTIATDSKTKNITLRRLENSQKKYKVHVVTNSGKLWDTLQESAIEKGNVIHELMASIYTHEDLDSVVENALETGLISHLDKESLYKELKMVLEHPKLFKYFSAHNIVLNERDIISNGRIYRPDRVVIDTNGIASIIDYKTGEYSSSHAKQLEEYSMLLQKIGYKLNEKILVYFNTEITLKYI
ncbi:ATP-dependent exoDNAse (exonuclease V) beta subunit (contains helicase and exonuclease domains) [Aquimarina amphilecti]|uniref:DNA 3'-5' helicase n=1 Tax=Aquimarina amphilecti TaxID=1038014 RepID=A0A1H7K7T0_AQUAM|nr:UvrD-helicase domain-containing protein [Aquimarina amphilecti]SEK82540.1 ATP-dependent exoDNAse (exonuclease V) beta subunit (contains helicase and exonuclease domains) [Aquimarina amphilecti]